MNPTTNKFEMLTEIQQTEDQMVLGRLYRPNGKKVPKHWSIFREEEKYEINGYTFVCKYIGETSILFEPAGIPELGSSTDGK